MLTSHSVFNLVQRPVLPVEGKYVRLRNHFCGICGSDMSVFEGRRTTDYPLSMGHEFVAEVLELGKGVEGLSVGDLVTSDLNYRCQNCAFCRKGKTHLCEMGQIGLFSNRAFSLFSDVHFSYLEKIPASSPKPFMTLAEPLSCILHAYKTARPIEIDRILVVGAGGLGACLTFLLMNLARFPFDIVEKSAERRAKIQTCLGDGARALHSPDGRYELVFDVSGTPEGLLLACQSVADGGRLCSMSHLDGYGDISFLLPELTRKDVALHLSYLNGARDNLREAVDLLVSYWTEPWNTLINTHSVDQLQSTFNNRQSSAFNKDVIDLTHLRSVSSTP